LAKGGSKAKKRDRQKRARHRRQTQQREKASKAAWEELNTLRDRLKGQGSPEADLAGLRSELDAWLAPVDAFDAISSLGLAAYLNRHDDSGTQRRLDSYVVEYGAVTLLRRAERAAGPAQDNAHGWSGEIQPLDFLLNMTLMASRDAEGSLPRGSEKLTQAQQQAQFGYMNEQLFAHDPVPPDREINRLVALFEPFEETLYECLGFTALTAAAICTALSLAKGSAMSAYFGLDEGLDPMQVREELQRRADQKEPPELGLIVHPGLGSALAVTPAQVAEIVGFPAENVEAFFQRLKIGFGDIRNGDPWQQIRVFRSRPLIEDGAGNWIVPVPYDVIYTVRGLLEDALRENGDLPESYQSHRAAYLEKRTREILDDALKPNLSLRTLSYEDPKEGEQKLPEGDGLIVIDRIALACEAKAGGLSPAARGGQPQALAKAFNRLLFEAIEQAERTRAALASGRPVRGVDDSTATVEVDRDQLSRSVPIAVTLEDLSGPSSKLWELMDREPTGVAPEDWPWIVNIDDLSWFAEELPLGVELLHYILVRQRLASIGEMRIGNEADWFRFYRNQGAARAIEIVSTAQEGEFDSRTLFVSDARRGRFDPDMPPAELAVRPLVQLLDRERPPGWLVASMALLDLHPEQGAELMDGLDEKLKRGAVAAASVRPAADIETELTIRTGTLEASFREPDPDLEKPIRRVALAFQGPLESGSLSCSVEQPPLG
jgi:hypothetical protein